MGIELGEALQGWESITSDVSELGTGLDPCLHLLFFPHLLLIGQIFL